MVLSICSFSVAYVMRHVAKIASFLCNLFAGIRHTFHSLFVTNNFIVKYRTGDVNLSSKFEISSSADNCLMIQIEKHSSQNVWRTASVVKQHAKMSPCSYTSHYPHYWSSVSVCRFHRVPAQPQFCKKVEEKIFLYLVQYRTVTNYW